MERDRPAPVPRPIGRGRTPVGVSLVIEDEASLDFSRGILAPPPRVLRGDPLLSLMAGSLSIVIGIVNLSALIGLAPESIPNLARRATIVLVPSVNGLGGKWKPGWWFVPDEGFLTLAAFALALAAAGIYLSRHRGRPVTSLVGFWFNTVVMVAGYALIFTDGQP